MSKQINRKVIWYPARVLQLETRAQDMTIAELADWFGETADCIRKACNYYGIEYLSRAGGNQHAKRPKLLNAKESIALFKTRYKTDLFHQLLTKNWSQHEQIRIN